MRKVIFPVLVSAMLAACAMPLNESTRLSNFGFEAMQKNDNATVEKQLNEALKANADNPYALLNLGAIHQNTNRPQQAREIYTKLIALNPNILVGQTMNGKEGTPIVQMAKDNLAKLPQ